VTDAALQRQIEELQRQLADRDRQIIELREAIAALMDYDKPDAVSEMRFDRQ
jgi:prefoldin subunit 5